MWLSSDAVHGCMVYTERTAEHGSSFTDWCDTSCVSAVSTDSTFAVDIKYALWNAIPQTSAINTGQRRIALFKSVQPYNSVECRVSPWLVNVTVFPLAHSRDCSTQSRGNLWPTTTNRSRQERNVSPGELHRLTSAVGITPLTDHYGWNRDTFP